MACMQRGSLSGLDPCPDQYQAAIEPVVSASAARRKQARLHLLNLGVNRGRCSRLHPSVNLSHHSMAPQIAGSPLQAPLGPARPAAALAAAGTAATDGSECAA